MYKKITATAKEVVTSVKDGAKTVEVPQKYFEVELKGLGEGAVPDPSLFRYNGDSAQALETFSKLFGKPIADLSSATAIFHINAVKALTEFQTTSDNLLLTVGRMREIDDGLQNRLANNDILFANFGKTLLEQRLVMSNTCTANLQDYMSASYVDAGYIGVNYAL